MARCGHAATRPVGNGEHQAAPDSACHGASPRAVEDSATPREEETEGDEEGGGIVVDNTIVCVGCRCERWRTAATPRPGTENCILTQNRDVTGRSTNIKTITYTLKRESYTPPMRIYQRLMCYHIVF